MAKARQINPRIIVAVLLLGLVVVVVLQNTEPVDTRFLFATVSMPRALLLVLTLLAGFALGLLAARWGPRVRGREGRSNGEETP